MIGTIKLQPVHLENEPTCWRLLALGGFASPRMQRILLVSTGKRKTVLGLIECIVN